MKLNLKGLLQKPFVKNVLAPVVRGVVKQIPFVGTPLMEVISNLTGPKVITVTGTDGKPMNVELPKKHNWVSIIVQSVLAVCVVYAFYTKAITIQEVVALVKGIFGMP